MLIHGGMNTVLAYHQNRDHHFDSADGAFRQVAPQGDHGVVLDRGGGEVGMDF